MKRFGLVVGLLAALGLLTACTPRSAEEQQGSSAIPTERSSSTIAVVGDTDGLVRLSWSDTGKQHSGMPVVSIENEACVTPTGVTVEETSKSVTVTAWGAKQQEPCAAVGYALAGSVPLQVPLGDRTLKHGQSRQQNGPQDCSPV